MTPTEFSLQRVLDYRRGVADRLQLALNVRLAEQAQAEASLEALRAAERVAVDRLTELQCDVLDMAQVTRLTAELDGLLWRIHEQTAAVRRARAESEAARARVVQASQDVKALEKLRERKQDETIQEQRRLERIEMSEIAAEQYRRQVATL